MPKYRVAFDMQVNGEWVRPGDYVELSEEDGRQRLIDGHVQATNAAARETLPITDQK